MDTAKIYRILDKIIFFGFAALAWTYLCVMFEEYIHDDLDEGGLMTVHVYRSYQAVVYLLLPIAIVVTCYLLRYDFRRRTLVMYVWLVSLFTDLYLAVGVILPAKMNVLFHAQMANTTPFPVAVASFSALTPVFIGNGVVMILGFAARKYLMRRKSTIDSK